MVVGKYRLRLNLVSSGLDGLTGRWSTPSHASTTHPLFLYPLLPSSAEVLDPDSPLSGRFVDYDIGSDGLRVLCFFKRQEERVYLVSFFFIPNGQSHAQKLWMPFSTL